jgi:hypothetical protein
LACKRALGQPGLDEPPEDALTDSVVLEPLSQPATSVAVARRAVAVRAAL